MKILHTSDWHIGRQFHNVSLLEDQRFVLDQIVEIASKSSVDVVLIAGDIYDRAIPPASAVKLLDDVLQRLCMDQNIPVIMISGNHDSPDRLGFGSRQLASGGLHIVGPLTQELAPIILKDIHGDVAFYGLPYADPATVRDVFGVELSGHDEAMAFLTEKITKHNVENRRCAVLSHCFLHGGDECESERPLSVGGADQVAAKHFKPFNYTALGHLHGPQYRGNESIRYSGSILKYSFSEVNHHKSVTLATMDAKGACVIEQFKLTPRRNMRVIEGVLEEIIQVGKTDPHSHDYLLVRLLDTNAILDVMGKLRSVYPNILHVERPGLVATNTGHNLTRDHLKRGEFAMFNDFYKQTSGKALNPEESKVVEGILDDVHSKKEG